MELSGKAALYFNETAAAQKLLVSIITYYLF